MQKKLAQVTRLGAEYLSRYGVSDALAEAEYLISSALNIRRTDIYLRGDEDVPEETLAILRRMIMERATTGKPSSYITGKKEFYGLEFSVNEECLIPRPETEIMVEEIINSCSAAPHEASSPAMTASGRTLNALDIGCGSGNIAICLAKFIEKIFVWAVDISYGAVLKTLENALANGVYPKIAAYKGDLFSPFSDVRYKGFFDIIVSNPPYIADKDLPSLDAGVYRFEPRVALAGGSDGLEFYRRIIPAAKFFLARGGRIYLEMGAGQRKEIEDMFKMEGYSGIIVRQDYNGIDRVISASF